MLTVQNKIGIRALGDCAIKCSHLKPFLSLKKGQRANLPKGKYFVNGGIEVCKPLTFVIPEFPKKEREIIPDTIEYSFNKDPNKATNRFTPLKGSINIDPFIMYDLPAFCKRFVYLHEIAHYYFTTESKCDKTAVIMMLKGGYMPSQILKAVELTLSSKERKDLVKKILKKV